MGANAWLVDEMYEQYQSDPDSVGENWREFFADYRPLGVAATTTATPAATAPPTNGNGTTSRTPDVAPTPPATPGPNGTAKAASADDAPGTPIRGIGARIVTNMTASLDVPTATSYREVPARLLEVNRSIINGYLGRTRGGKVSFTHLIGYAVVRAIADNVTVMNDSFATDSSGGPRRVKNESVSLGLAIDIEKSDGTRSLIVPVIRDASSKTFAEFIATYDELVRKATSNKLTPDDFVGSTVTLTNPGTIGTERSVPRLMPGQGTIVGVGSLGYPTAFAAADPRTIADLGISKVMTISSTYDHRIIQGAESGLFLKKVSELLLGADSFYEAVFHSIGVPYTPVQWRLDINPVDREETMVAKQMQVANLINMHRVRGHLIADLDPLAAEPPMMHAELDPATYGLTIWDNDREFLTGLQQGVYAPVGGQERMKLGDILHTLRDAYCRTIGI